MSSDIRMKKRKTVAVTIGAITVVLATIVTMVICCHRSGGEPGSTKKALCDMAKAIDLYEVDAGRYRE